MVRPPPYLPKINKKVNKCERRSCVVPIDPPNAHLLPPVSSLAEEWVSAKAVADTMLRMFCRHIDYSPEQLLPERADVRLFIAELPVAVRQGDGAAAAGPAAGATAGAGLQGFVLLDPLYEGGVTVGYVESICRMRMGAATGRRRSGAELGRGWEEIWESEDGWRRKGIIHEEASTLRTLSSDDPVWGLFSVSLGGHQHVQYLLLLFVSYYLRCYLL